MSLFSLKKAVPHVQRVKFGWCELATAMLRKADIHDGIWEVRLVFERTAMKVNWTMPDGSLKPTAGCLVVVPDIYLERITVQLVACGECPGCAAKEPCVDPRRDMGPMAVDAAVVNPRHTIQ